MEGSKGAQGKEDDLEGLNRHLQFVKFGCKKFREGKS